MDLGGPEKGALLPVFCAGRSPSMGTAVALLGQMPILSKSKAVRGAVIRANRNLLPMADLARHELTI